MLPQIVLDGLARYERQNSKIRKTAPKRALTQDEKIERLERKVASLRGILVSSKTAQDALNFRAALCEYRCAVLRGDEWLDGKTQFDFAPIDSPEIPAGMEEFAHVCRNTGMVVFEFSDFAKVLHPYDYSDPDWVEKSDRAHQMVFDWLNERKTEVYVWNYDKPWNEPSTYDKTIPGEWDCRLSHMLKGVKYWVRYYTS